MIESGDGLRNGWPAPPKRDEEREAATVAPEAPNRAQHRIASTNPHPIMGNGQSMAHDAHGAGEAEKCARNGPKYYISKLPYTRPKNAAQKPR